MDCLKPTQNHLDGSVFLLGVPLESSGTAQVPV